jgi:hypothetical protein
MKKPTKPRPGTAPVPDKRPKRAPQRPEAARYERGRKTGSKRRLGK